MFGSAGLVFARLNIDEFMQYLLPCNKKLDLSYASSPELFSNF